MKSIWLGTVLEREARYFGSRQLGTWSLNSRPRAFSSCFRERQSARRRWPWVWAPDQRQQRHLGILSGLQAHRPCPRSTLSLCVNEASRAVWCPPTLGTSVMMVQGQVACVHIPTVPVLAECLWASCLAHVCLSSPLCTPVMVWILIGSCEELTHVRAIQGEQRVRAELCYCPDGKGICVGLSKMTYPLRSFGAFDAWNLSWCNAHPRSGNWVNSTAIKSVGAWLII